jgi:hypothetical protein
MTLSLKVAGERALADLADGGLVPDRILLDGNIDFLRQPGRVRTIIKGDLSSFAIAAASVVAKATRDALMEQEAEHFPAYGFESNRGYPAPVHKCALAAYGATTIHRRTWIFMDGLPWADDPVPEALDAQLSLFDDPDRALDLTAVPVDEPAEELLGDPAVPDLLWEFEDAPEPLAAVPSGRRRSG